MSVLWNGKNGKYSEYTNTYKSINDTNNYECSPINRHPVIPYFMTRSVPCTLFFLVFLIYTVGIEYVPESEELRDEN
jgi:hypothetical protein